MAFIDYLTLLLVNMTAGLAVLAWFFARGLLTQDRRVFVAPFALTGLIALVGGLAITLTWPITQNEMVWANMTFGEPSVLLGGLFLAAALCLAMDWRLHVLGLYALVAGLVGILLGVGILMHGLTAQPILSGWGFILTGLAGVLSLPVLLRPSGKALRTLIVDLVLATLIWALTAYMSYWMHLISYSK